MKIIKIGFFVFVAVFLLQTKTTFATGYSYLPNDIYIKQQEEKSALEYRLKSLESQIQNNPSVSVNTIEQRIVGLQRERDTEKSYVSYVYPHNGIADQLPAKLAEIDAKYQPQIDDLEQQKSSYQSQASSLDKANKEAQEIRLQLIALQKQYIQQLDDYQKLLDQNLELLKKAPQSTTPVEFSDSEVQEIFDYMESLSFKDESIIFNKIAKVNPVVAGRIVLLYDKRYPNGKTGSPKNDAYLKPTTKTPIIVPKKEEKIPPVQEVKKLEQKPVQDIVAPTIADKPIIAPAPVQEKPSFGKRIKNFFTKWFR